MTDDLLLWLQVVAGLLTFLALVRGWEFVREWF